jgi:hypothetical protein
VQEDAMRSREGLAGRLPDEIIERVLSLLPVPALCMFRSVCKAWNELLRKPAFLDLCDASGGHDAYLFVTGHLTDFDCCWVDDAYRRATCFLDLENRRWYSIPVGASLLAPTDENVPRLLAMADGLVCELSALSSTYEEYTLVVFDPVAQTRRELPTLPYDDGRRGPVLCLKGDALPAVVTVVDTAARTFKVFLLNSRTMEPHTGFFVYESSSGAWRGLPNPPEELGVRVAEVDGRRVPETAVFFRGQLYATFFRASSSTLLLLCFSLEEDSWREILAVQSTNPGYPQLTVTGDRLFVAMWLDGPRRARSSEETRFSTTRHTGSSVFEIKEILVDEDTSESVVRIPYAELRRIFGEQNEVRLQFDIAFGFPLNCSSVVVLVSRLTGKLITYNVSSGSVRALPLHPLRRAPSALEGQILASIFHAKLMSLSLRNILTGPVTQV